MAKIYFLFLFIPLSMIWACLQPSNRILIDKNGQLVVSDSDFDIDYDLLHVQRQNPNYIKKMLLEYKGKCDTSNLYDDYIQYSSFLVLDSSYDEALGLLKMTESRFPGHYETAANRGTVYELLGMPDSALMWIRRGVALNPKSHNGSEWIHVKILEAKVSKDSAWLNDDFLLGHHFGNDSIPHTHLDSAALVKLRNDLFYQLGERMYFIKSNDLIMGRLLFEYGTILSYTNNVTMALNVFRIAKKYGYDTPLMLARYRYFYQIENRGFLELRMKLEEEKRNRDADGVLPPKGRKKRGAHGH